MATVAELLKAGRIRRERIDSAGDVAVATTGTLILRRNPNRVNIVIVNPDGTNFVIVRWGRPMTASTDPGIRLGTAGGNYVDKYSDIGDAIGDELYAVADTAQVTLSVQAWEVY